MSAEMQAQAYICPACYDDHDPAQPCTANDGGYDCTTCGSRWGGYHSGTFCRLFRAFRQQPLVLRPTVAALAQMALVADGKAYILRRKESR